MKLAKKRSLIIVTLLATLAVVGVLFLPRVRAYFQGTSPRPGTLDWYAQQAQSQGLSQYGISAGAHEYFESSNWDDALSRFTFVVAEPIDSRSYAHAADGIDTDIETWYRFRVIETLSLKPSPIVLPNAPSDLAPAQSDQILVFQWGGVVVRNGVQIIQEDLQFPRYITGQRYLLLLNLNQSNRVGDVPIGANGVYLLNSSGVITSANPNGSAFQSDLASRYGNSLDQLRASLVGP